MDHPTQPGSFLAQFKTPAPDPKPPGSGVGPTAGFDSAVIEAELDNVRRATEGTRNATLNQAAFNLRQLYPADIFYSPLCDAARECGLDRIEAERTIESAFRGAERNPRPAYRMPHNGAMRPVETLPSIDGYTEPERRAPVDWAEFWATEQRDEWIVEPILVKGGQTVIYSAPKVGKSLLALEIAVGIATGRPVLGAPPVGGTVLYIDHENRMQGDVKPRLQAMGHDQDTDLSKLVYMSLQDYPPLDTPEGARDLLGDVDHYQPLLVILDTVSRTISGDENDNSTWLNWYRLFGKELKARDIALLRLDHTGKDETKGQRGGSAKSGDVDLVWNLETVVKDATYTLRCPGLNRVEISEDLLVIHRDREPLRHRVDAAGYKGAMDARRAHALAQLDATGAPKDLGVVAATEWLREHDVPCRNGTLTKEVLHQRSLGTI